MSLLTEKRKIPEKLNAWNLTKIVVEISLHENVTSVDKTWHVKPFRASNECDTGTFLKKNSWRIIWWLQRPLICNIQ